MHERISYSAEKKVLYKRLSRQLSALMADEREPMPNMANISALIFHELPDINWAGFYINLGTELLLGPFQGKPACIRIPMGRGVCGTAAQTRKAQIVTDVHEFAGHIACDAASRSELVIPLVIGERLIGVLDIDSPTIGRFDEDDLVEFSALVQQMVAGCDWPMPDFKRK